jgi:hypothetical protein
MGMLLFFGETRHAYQLLVKKHGMSTMQHSGILLTQKSFDIIKKNK